MSRSDYVKADFSFDGETYFPGEFIPTDRWNGFACPRFDLDTALQILQSVCEANGAGETFRHDKSTDALVFNDADGGKHSYAADEDGFFHVGSSEWTWMERVRVSSEV
jgi:hypothetical protein